MAPFLEQNIWILVLLALWTLPWKGVALWKAAGNDHKWWFVIMFLLNDLGILEIAYIFYFSKRSKTGSEVV